MEKWVWCCRRRKAQDDIDSGEMEGSHAKEGLSQSCWCEFSLCVQTSYNLHAREMTRRLHSVKFRLDRSLDWRAKRLE